MKLTIPNIGWTGYVSDGGAAVSVEAETLDEAAEIIYGLWGSDPEYIEDNLPDGLDATIGQFSTTLNIVSTTISWTDVLEVLDVNKEFGWDGWRDNSNKPEVVAYIKTELAKFTPTP
jgi:hypothetical protein